MSQNTQERGEYPIVFVPGLFGSMSDTIIPGTGDWHFGVAGIVYEPFIRLLEKELGLIEGKNLFIAYYDWRKPIKHSAKHYLYDTIQNAKKISKQQKVNIICHSMGGLVSRAYAESSYYQNDIEKMIIMCTPSAGSAPNFSYWTGGSLPINSGEKLNLVRLYMTAYLWLLSKIYPTDEITAIHTHFKGLHDIVPSRSYGEYLLSKHDNTGFSFLPYDSMNTKNHFLDDLNVKQEKTLTRKIDLTLIAGVGEETIKYFEVETSSSKNAWVDGKVINAITTEAGDGNATLDSVFAIEGDKHVVKGSHNEVLFKSLPIIAHKLGINNSNTTQTVQLNEDYSLLLVQGNGKLELRYECGSQYHEKESSMYSICIHGLTCVFLPENLLKSIKGTYMPTEDEILTYTWIKKNGTIENTVKVYKENNYLIL